MTLPKIEFPLFEMKWPSKNKDVKVRPFLVKEEKILLIAQEGGSDRDITLGIKQILNNCVQDKSFNVKDLTTFDLDYMFLKLRAKSVSNEVTLSYTDLEDQKTYDFTINLDDIELTYNDKHTNKIPIDDKRGLIMKYPSVEMVSSIPMESTYLEAIDIMIRNCIDKVYDGDEVTIVADETTEELNEFLEMLPVSVYQKLKEFFETMPKLYYKIEYENAEKHKRVIELTNLKDFFTWG